MRAFKAPWAARRPSLSRRAHSLEDALQIAQSELGHPPVVLVGSWVSVPPPSSLASVPEITSAILSGTMRRLSQSAPVGLDARVRAAPFEETMEALQWVAGGVEAMLDALFAHGAPNAHHEQIRQWLLEGRTPLVLTTNFDQMIEAGDKRIRAIGDEGDLRLLAEVTREPGWTVSLAPTVCHLHGIAGSSPSNIRAFMRQVARSSTGHRAAIVEAADKIGLLTIGWSGSDLDIAPLVRNAWRVQKPNGHADRRDILFNLVLETDSGATAPDLAPVDMWLDALSSAQLRAVAGVLRLQARDMVGAVRELRAAIVDGAGPPARMALAAALAQQFRFAEAARVVTQEATLEPDVWGRWVGDSILYLREAGRPRRAVSVGLGALPEARMRAAGGGPDALWDALVISWNTVESGLLLASRARSRTGAANELEALLDESAEWLGHPDAASLPDYHQTYRMAELALLRGDLAEAEMGYSTYLRDAARWTAANARALAMLRLAVVQAARGRRIQATYSWVRGLASSVRLRSPGFVVEYIAAVPVLLSGRVDLYWWLRRQAPRTYPMFAFGRRLLWERGPRSGRPVGADARPMLERGTRPSRDATDATAEWPSSLPCRSPGAASRQHRR